MKVLTVNDYSDQRGGAEMYVAALRELLEARGHTTALLAGDASGIGSLAARAFSPRQYRRASNVIRTFMPDIVHMHNCGRNMSPAPAIAAHRAGIPVVMTVHDAQLVCPKTWMIDSAGQSCATGFGAGCVAKNCHTTRMGIGAVPYHAGKVAKVAIHRGLLRRSVDTYICPSRWLQDWIRSAFPSAQVVHIPNFAESRGEPAIAERSVNDLLFCGRLVPEKGADLVLDALALVPHVRLDIAGDGPERGRLERRCTDLGIADRVTFHGRLGADRLNTLRAGATALVVPSRWSENSPLVVLEALAAGLPVIGARRAGIAELVCEGKTGALFAPDDAHDLARAIALLLDDEELRARARRESIAWTTRAFTPERHVAAVEAVYVAARDRAAAGARHGGAGSRNAMAAKRSAA